MMLGGSLSGGWSKDREAAKPVLTYKKGRTYEKGAEMFKKDDTSHFSGRRARGPRTTDSSRAHAPLRAEYGKGWSEQQLRHCIRAAEVFPDESIFSALRRELSWTHLKMLMYVEDPLKRDFYIELCRLERWSSRQLQERMQSMLFERSALSHHRTK